MRADIHDRQPSAMRRQLVRESPGRASYLKPVRYSTSAKSQPQELCVALTLEGAAVKLPGIVFGQFQTEELMMVAGQ
ncbi:hypothetical protein GCM10007880_65310 [Mesorhizobium amorphae]|nr:hypothetical protein GCM10007880_65310 [Mesorhizobium amorphae]